jgi:hypothetical protein
MRSGPQFHSALSHHYSFNNAIIGKHAPSNKQANQDQKQAHVGHSNAKPSGFVRQVHRNKAIEATMKTTPAPISSAKSMSLNPSTLAFERAALVTNHT